MTLLILSIEEKLKEHFEIILHSKEGDRDPSKSLMSFTALRIKGVVMEFNGCHAQCESLVSGWIRP